ncbi:MAG: DnaJ domain-containing protein [Desulfotignum sp.]|nr:DnaJ domain-containing protein [Desulfotignum sp.]
MPRDYYLILGIASDASQTDIKDAYRRLAKTYHPDHYKGNSGPFQDIQEAYDVLSDSNRRRAHDAQMQTRRPVRREPAFSGPLETMVPEPRAESFFRPAPHRRIDPYPPASNQQVFIRFRFGR